MKITIDLPQHIQESLNLTPQQAGKDISLYATLMLYQLGELSSGMAAEMAGISRVELLELCGWDGVSVFQYTAEDVLAELS